MGTHVFEASKVARLKEFELLAIKLNDNNVEVISTVGKKPHLNLLL
jgi:hypothetical protein